MKRFKKKKHTVFQTIKGHAAGSLNKNYEGQDPDPDLEVKKYSDQDTDPTKILSH
jgi:hypothetical protein